MQNRTFATSILAGALGLTLLTGAPATADSHDEDVPADCRVVTETEIVVISPERIEQRLISPAVEPVIRIEYEYVHRNENHPNSPRWEAEGWNSDDNPASFGYASTGQTRTVVITPGADAVYETVTIPAVTEEREHSTVVCPVTGGTTGEGGTDQATEPERTEPDNGAPAGSGDAGNGNGKGAGAPAGSLTTETPAPAPVTTGQGAVLTASSTGQTALQVTAPEMAAQAGASLAYTGQVEALAQGSAVEAFALTAVGVPVQSAAAAEQLAYTGTIGDFALYLGGGLLALGVGTVATSRHLTRRAAS